MRFVVTVTSKYPIPPEAALGVFEGTLAWGEKYTRSGNLKDAWGFAGSAGGGGILEASSAEEVSAIITECPMMPFAETTVVPIVSLKTAMEDTIKAVKAMIPPKGKYRLA